MRRLRRARAGSRALRPELLKAAVARFGVILTGSPYALLVVLPLLADARIPAHRHDWLWPALRSQVVPFALTGIEAWHRNGDGSAAAYPEFWLTYALFGASCEIFGPSLGLVAVIGGSLLIAGAGVDALLRALEIRRWPIRAGAVAAYVSTPMVLNEVQAGHISLLLAYAIFPSLGAVIVRGSRPWAVGLALGLCAVQHQWLVFGCVLLAVYRLGTGRFDRRDVGSLAIAAVIAAPIAVVALFGDLNVYDGFAPTREWQLAQSAPFDSSLRGLGYTAAYDLQLGGWQAAYWALPAGVVVGLAGLYRSAAARTFGALFLLGAVAAAGTRTIFAPAADALFAHVYGAAVFREVYDFAQFTTLGGIVVVALGSRARIAAVRRTCALLLAVLAFAGLRTAWLSAAGLPRFENGATLGVMAALLPSLDDAAARFRTLAPAGAHAGGLGPEDLAIGGHPSAGESRNSSSANEVGLLIAAGPPLRVIRRPTARLAVLAHGSGTENAADALLASGKPLSLFGYDDVADPARGWGRTVAFPQLPAWTGAHGDGLVTFRRSIALPLHRAALVLAAAASGDLRSDECVLRRRVDSRFELLACGAGAVLEGTPPLIVASAFANGRALPPRRVRGAPGRAAIARNDDERIVASVDGVAGSVLVLHERFSSQWRLDRPWPHVRIAPNLNGWLLPRDTTHATVTIAFVPALPHLVSVVISMTLAAGISVAALLLAMRARGFGSRRGGGPAATERHDPV